MALEKVADGGACACVLAEMGPLGCWVTPGLARDWKVLERVLEGGERKPAACPPCWARPLDHWAWHVPSPGPLAARACWDWAGNLVLSEPWQHRNVP